ncbi:head-tail connector protein [Paracoccus siganidrum]|uniref:Phage gp6-like head-tail connector protein n=1 Tax=Paracoccus siganidrum TaxID=1276757 RepID=A0A419A8R6_9RHOB|nr:hypothetical protein [Paracoccus siganidrum]RJL18656.1 hypothetical protein D3P05_06805 [Paracoccus siganidrum]RMC36836.1 hypothetical protein C9E82_09800 [Paracoccus siganidrum]
MIIERLNRPATAAVDLPAAKLRGRIDFGDDDADLEVMGGAVTREAEDYAQIALLTQTIRVCMSAWPRASIFHLPITPLLDWSSVSVTAGGEAFEDFAVMTGRRPALRLTGPRPAGEIIIDYLAGFGDQPEDIPDDLRHALLDQVAAYYDARGSTDRNALSPHFVRIVGRYRGVRA